MSSRSFNVGSYTRHIDTPESEFDLRVRAFKDDTIDALPDTFENWPKERVLEAELGLQRANQKVSTLRQNADAFASLHSEYLDTPENGKRFNNTLKAMFGDCAHTVEQFEAAYQVLRANNTLDLDQAEIVKQEQAATNQRNKAARDQRARDTRTYTEDEKYSMSLDQLRQLETREIQQRMQRRGEEGGW